MCVKGWVPVFFGQPPYCFPLLLYLFSILTEFCPVRELVSFCMRWPRKSPKSSPKLVCGEHRKPKSPKSK